MRLMGKESAGCSKYQDLEEQYSLHSKLFNFNNRLFVANNQGQVYEYDFSGKNLLVKQNFKFYQIYDFAGKTLVWKYLEEMIQ